MKPLLTSIITIGLICSCSTPNTHSLITTLPSGLDINNLTDCTIPARFNAKDFNWRGSNLTFEVFSEDLYDAVEVLGMKAGDTLLYCGEKMVVTSISENKGTLEINGGVEEGGAWLMPAEGGTYRSYTLDDHSTYTSLGTAHVILAEDFRIIDCGPNPEDPSDTISTEQKLYLDTLRTWRQDFYQIDTKVQIEKIAF